MKTITINPIFILIAIIIFAAYNIYKNKIPTSKKMPNQSEDATNKETNNAYTQEQNFTTQDMKEEYKKINDKIIMTNILLLIIAITLIAIAYCTIQDYIFKKDIINNTNNTINEIFKFLN